MRGPAFARSRDLVLTLAIGAAGGLIASALSLPVAWLLGPVIATSLASLAGVDTNLPDLLRTLAFFILGIQAGSGVSPEVVDQIAVWPLSFVIQLVGVFLAIVLCYGFLRWAFAWDHATALFASLPGALSFVMAAATETRADLTRVAIVQSIRLLLLIGALVPSLAFLEGGGEAEAASRSGVGGTLVAYAMLFAFCAATAALSARLKVPGGMMLGALIGSALLHGSDLVTVSLPPSLAIPSLVLLGVLIGSRLTGIDLPAFLRLLPASIGCFALSLAACALAGAAVVALLELAPGKVALAYAPGALEALTVLAFQFDIDPAYVAAHHVIRFMAIAMIVPFLGRKIARDELGREEPRRSGTQ